MHTRAAAAGSHAVSSAQLRPGAHRLLARRAERKCRCLITNCCDYALYTRMLPHNLADVTHALYIHVQQCRVCS